MYEPVLSGSNTNMAASGTPAIPENNSVNYSASSTSQEHKKLFAAYPRGHARRGSYSGNTKGKGKGKRVPTCTLKFFCLSRTDTAKPPTAVRDRTVLINAGLGDASIQFKAEASSVECHQEIVSRFPKLLETGYELLLYQRGEDAGLYNIPAPYTAQRMRDAAGNAKIYIRPLQKDLDESALEEPSGLFEVEDGPTVTCLRCGMSVPMVSLSSHIADEHPDAEKEAHKAKKQRTIDQLASIMDQYEEVDTPDPSTRSSENTTTASSLLEEICPDATSVEIEAALSASGGDANQAAQALLGAQREEDDDVGDLVPMLDIGNNAPQPVDAVDALRRFRDDILETNKARQLFTVSRMEGMEELKLDVLVNYKSRTSNLKAHPRVRFEQEEGAGSGPVREFLCIAMKIADEGMVTSSKPVIFFEGEKDHRLPVHDQSLRLTGSFKAIGRIIGHCALHGGPALHGLSPAVKYYLSNSTLDLFETPPPLSVHDIPDIDLRQLITEIDSLGKDDRPSAELRASVLPYLLEAGLDIDKLISDPGLITQGLILFNVLLKRKLELDDIVRGMEELGLGSALKKWPVLADAIFPEDSKRSIRAEEFKRKVTFEEREANAKTADYFVNYIELIESRKEDDGPNLVDLCSFWTGTNTLPSGITEMLIKFDDNIELPIAETCFLSMTIPTKHHTFEEFCKYFDIAVKYGGQGFSFA